MNRLTPAKLVAEMKNATSGEVAPSASTSGVRPTPTSQEIVMTNDTPSRPWLDAGTARHLTAADLTRLDGEFARWTENAAGLSGVDLVEYIRDCATDQARVRQIIGPHEVPLPEFATVHKHSDWRPTADGTDCVRDVDALYADRNGLNASLEVDQYAVSTRLDMRVRVGEGVTESPEELTRWALDLLNLAGRWSEIRETTE